jgi:ketosteroid isomerase-like protein
MSQRNVHSLRRLLAAFGRRDFDRAVLGAAEDVELRPAVEGIDVDTLVRGRVELRGFFEQITETWETVTIEPKEVLEAPGERLVAFERWHLTGRDGLGLDLEIFTVYTFRDGLVARIDGFRDKAEALEAVGLSE